MKTAANPKSYLRIPGMVLVCSVWSLSNELSAWTNSPSELNLGIELPVSDMIQEISPSLSQIKKRVYRNGNEVSIEPMSIPIPKSLAKQQRLIEKISRPGESEQIFEWFADPSKQILTKYGKKKLRLDSSMLPLFDLQALQDIYTKRHHRLILDGAILRSDPVARDQLLQQVGPFIGKDKSKKLTSQIAHRREIIVSNALLPEFPSESVGKYSIHRGPNCFHAALAFHGEQITNSPFFNVREESGYHRKMINYDELWRAIQLNFYEIDPQKTDLKYGDMIVFFDVPTSSEYEVYFRWIKHASTYLFNHYVFSKGSKSADSIYAIRTIEEEWSAWKRRTENLAIKVFRRSLRHVKTTPPRNLQDWIF